MLLKITPDAPPMESSIFFKPSKTFGERRPEWAANTLGDHVSFHTGQGFPALDGVKVALFGVLDDPGHAKPRGCVDAPDAVRAQLAWDSERAGTINAGLSPSESEVAWAHGFIDAFEKSGGKITDGSDLPRLARAQKIIQQAQDFGIEVEAAEVSHSGY